MTLVELELAIDGFAGCVEVEEGPEVVKLRSLRFGTLMLSTVLNPYIACCQSVLIHSSNQRVLCGPQTSQGILTPGAKDVIGVRGDPDRQLEDVEELSEDAGLTRGGVGLEVCVGKGLKVGKGGYMGVNNDEDEDNIGEFGGTTGDRFVEDLLELRTLDSKPVSVAVVFLAFRLAGGEVKKRAEGFFTSHAAGGFNRF